MPIQERPPAMIQGDMKRICIKAPVNHLTSSKTIRPIKIHINTHLILDLSRQMGLILPQVPYLQMLTRLPNMVNQIHLQPLGILTRNLILRTVLHSHILVVIQRILHIQDIYRLWIWVHRTEANHRKCIHQVTYYLRLGFRTTNMTMTGWIWTLDSRRAIATVVLFQQAIHLKVG